jgi:hypothetical protein
MATWVAQQANSEARGATERVNAFESELWRWR